MKISYKVYNEVTDWLHLHVLNVLGIKMSHMQDTTWLINKQMVQSASRRERSLIMGGQPFSRGNTLKKVTPLRKSKISTTNHRVYSNVMLGVNHNNVVTRQHFIMVKVRRRCKKRAKLRCVSPRK